MAGDKNSGRKSKIIKPKRLVYRKKPKLIVKATVRQQQKYCRNETDEKALAAGFRFNEALAAHAIEFFPKFLKHSEGRWAGKSFESVSYTHLTLPTILLV